MSKEQFLLTKSIIQDTRNTIQGYVLNLKDASEKKAVVTLLKTKVSMDQMRQFAKEFGIEKEAVNFFEKQKEVEIEMKVEVEEEFKPVFEQAFEEEFTPSFEPTFETEVEEEFSPSFEEVKSKELNLEKKEQVEPVSRADYFGVSIAIRDISLKKEIEFKGVKEVKKNNESIVEFAKDLAKKVRETKNEMNAIPQNEHEI